MGFGNFLLPFLAGASQGYPAFFDETRKRETEAQQLQLAMRKLQGVERHHAKLEENQSAMLELQRTAQDRLQKQLDFQQEEAKKRREFEERRIPAAVFFHGMDEETAAKFKQQLGASGLLDTKLDSIYAKDVPTITQMFKGQDDLVRATLDKKLLEGTEALTKLREEITELDAKGEKEKAAKKLQEFQIRSQAVSDLLKVKHGAVAKAAEQPVKRDIRINDGKIVEVTPEGVSVLGDLKADERKAAAEERAEKRHENLRKSFEDTVDKRLKDLNASYRLIGPAGEEAGSTLANLPKDRTAAQQALDILTARTGVKITPEMAKEYQAKRELLERARTAGIDRWSAGKNPFDLLGSKGKQFLLAQIAQEGVPDELVRSHPGGGSIAPAPTSPGAPGKVPTAQKNPDDYLRIPGVGSFIVEKGTIRPVREPSSAPARPTGPLPNVPVPENIYQLPP